MKNKLLSKSIKIVISLVFWLLMWELASRIISENLSMFLPGPFKVFKRFTELIPEQSFWEATGFTLLRIFSGLTIGCILGIILGILTNEIPLIDIIVSPALKVIRAVPVVSFIILAFLFLNAGRLPVYISVLMVTPLVWQTVYDGLNSTDIKLIQMAQVYKIGKLKKLFFIKLPYCTDAIVSSFISAVGLAWKSGIAAEVICIPAMSIGKNIANAKSSFDFEGVYALTLTVVILSLIFEFLLKLLRKKYFNKEEKI